MLISLSGHLWSMWQSKCVVYFKLVMDLSCIPLQWTNTVKQFQRLMDKHFLGVQKVTSVFEKQTYGPILPWYCKQPLLLKTRQDQWQIQGRGPPPLIFRPNWGAEKILCETAPPYLRVLMTSPPPPYLKVWICHWGYKLLLLIDCYKQVTCGEWVKQRRRPLSSSLHSLFTLFSSAKYFPPPGGGMGVGYSHLKGVGMLVVSLRVFWAKGHYIKLQSLGHTQTGLL